MQPGPDRPVVPGLVYENDAAVAAKLDAVEADLQDLADDVDDLGTQARGALAAMISGTPDTVDAAIAQGDALLAGITAKAKAIRAELAAVPFVGRPGGRPPRLARRCGSGTPPHAGAGRDRRPRCRLEPADGRGRGGGPPLGPARRARPPGGRGRGTGPGREVQDRDRDPRPGCRRDRESRKLRDRIVASVDVTVLDQWLDRNEAYDKALPALYKALASVGGKVTKKVREAIDAEKAARARLPPDARGLVVIMADIGQGGLNGAVIAIEGAKADLADALEPVEEPSDAPSGSPSEAP